jgi:hypothetical protein
MLEKLDIAIIVVFIIIIIIIITIITIITKNKENYSDINSTSVIEPVIPFIDPIYRRQVLHTSQDPATEIKEINDLQQQFDHQNQEEDLADKYRYKSRSILYIEDPTLKSSNYHEFASFIRPDQLENKITDEKKKGYKIGDYGVLNLPVGYGYGFLDSPAIVQNLDPQLSKTIL